ncbi:alkaline shock response membrane anchor protein AmaP [Candidatus Bipolaricaulota bacterium]|nr:alkaline shock response membrane anchor protein AmaP [Candidatus Bipolaricaulota bacterium]HHR85529.1 alkaline shock response membrane anchor protein AmaP [Candidatus Acetothermia bacterium]
MTPFLLGVVAFVMLVTAGAGVLSILLCAGMFSLAASQQFFDALAGKVILYALGGVFLGVSFYFASLFYRGRVQLARFAQDGEWGKIELSPYALREFVSGIMRDEIGIDHFQVRLQHMGDGMSIRITTTLSPEDQVAEIGKRIQETLSRRVVERTGVEVREVAVLVNSIHSHEEEPVTHEEHDEHTDAS